MGFLAELEKLSDRLERTVKPEDRSVVYRDLKGIMAVIRTMYQKGCSIAEIVNLTDRPTEYIILNFLTVYHSKHEI